VPFRCQMISNVVGFICLSILGVYCKLFRRQWFPATKILPLLLLLDPFHMQKVGFTPETCGIFIGLILGAIGDLFLLEMTQKRFALGIVFFMLGHLSYISSFIYASQSTLGFQWVVPMTTTIPMFIFWILYQIFMIVQISKQKRPQFIIPCSCYLAVIISMAVIALNLEMIQFSSGNIQREWHTLSVGGFLFGFSDTLIFLSAFHIYHVPLEGFLILSTYYAAQGLIAFSTIHTEITTW